MTRSTARNSVHVDYPPNVLVTCDAGHNEWLPPAKVAVVLRCSVIDCEHNLRVVTDATRKRRAAAERARRLLSAQPQAPTQEPTP